MLCTCIIKILINIAIGADCAVVRQFISTDKKMKLTVLVDKNTLIDRYFLAEPGLSFLIEDGDTVVLFDTGYSDLSR